ncbi:RND transporter [Methylobacterium sp. V23]|nr:RND transporter [Methylobacterium sp. V23]
MRRNPLAAALSAAALLLCLWGGAAPAHEGHDHGEEAKSAPAVTAPRGVSSSDAFEVVVVARNGALMVYVDRTGSNEPVTGATVQAETPEGAVTATATPDGAYLVDAHWSEKPGAYDLTFTVTLADGTSDVFPVELEVPEPPAATAGPPTAWTSGLAIAHDFQHHLTQADPMAFVIGGTGFVLGVGLTLLLGRRRSAPAVAVLVLAAGVVLAPRANAHEGHDHGNEPKTLMAAPNGASRDVAQRLPDGSVFMPKPTQRLLTIRTVVTATSALARTTEMPGRVITDPNASGVVQSSVGGRLSPPPSGVFPRLGTPVAKGDVLAFVTPPIQAVDASDMRQRQGELDQQIAIVQRRVERFQKLAPGGAVSQVQLDEANAELSGLKDRRTALDKIRLQPEPLIAPVSGVIAEANAMAGQMASPGTMVFQITDPAKLWVEALSFEALAPAQNASARLADGRTLTLNYRGAGLADRSQAVPVQFAIEGEQPDLRTGQFVTVHASSSAPLQGLALPRASVVRSANGQALVYEHTQAERFEPREVQVEPLDAARVLVVSGIGNGKRVVTQGAELINQVR